MWMCLWLSCISIVEWVGEGLLFCCRFLLVLIIENVLLVLVFSVLSILVVRILCMVFFSVSCLLLLWFYGVWFEFLVLRLSN